METKKAGKPSSKSWDKLISIVEGLLTKVDSLHKELDKLREKNERLAQELGDQLKANAHLRKSAENLYEDAKQSALAQLQESQPKDPIYQRFPTTLGLIKALGYQSDADLDYRMTSLLYNYNNHAEMLKPKKITWVKAMVTDSKMTIGEAREKVEVFTGKPLDIPWG
jgi:FtsZ-binding cell division protein ZapB